MARVEAGLPSDKIGTSSLRSYGGVNPLRQQADAPFCLRRLSFRLTA
jgi:hypothetical protein